jgi:hypothetical protein
MVRRSHLEVTLVKSLTQDRGPKSRKRKTERWSSSARKIRKMYVTSQAENSMLTRKDRLPGMDLGHGQDGRSIRMPNTNNLPPELRVLANEHYIMNESKKEWSWDTLAQLLVRNTARDAIASGTSTSILVSKIQSNAACKANQNKSLRWIIKRKY